MIKFNEDFYIGAATAAHQVEGNNVNSDFWAMEQMEHSSFAEPSLDAVDHYNKYKEDIDLMSSAGLNAYRFGIEWSRIEPIQGEFSLEEIEHYRDVLKYCIQKDIEPIVTMHHFSSPKWLIDQGGWESEATITYFAEYCKFVIEHLGEYINYVCTINEANMGSQIAAVMKSFMKQMQADVQVGIGDDIFKGREKQGEEHAKLFGTTTPNTFLSMRTEEGDAIIFKSHVAARNEMKKLFPELKVGITLSIYDIQYQDGGQDEAENAWFDEFKRYIPYIEADDFLGVQNYTRKIFSEDGVMPMPEGCRRTQMDYEFYPEAISNVLRRVATEVKIPLFVTENGIAATDDTDRVEYIEQALSGIEKCIDDGIPVIGYLYWSLLDNFEWQKGFGMTFGLIAVDRTTQQRYPKKSLDFLGSYASQF